MTPAEMIDTLAGATPMLARGFATNLLIAGLAMAFGTALGAGHLLIHLGMSGRMLVSGHLPGGFHHAIAARAERQPITLTLSNPWSSTITGTLRFAQPEQWDFRPRVQSFIVEPGEETELFPGVTAKADGHAIVIDDLDAIVALANGTMVARGDLGIEIASEKVPMVQKKIIDRCREAGKPVITATQMLDSMMTNPRATRAESSDVANAVLDGTDSVMLSGETAAGEYPIEALQAMDKICTTVEKNASHIYNSLGYRKPEWKEKQIIESLAYSCVMLAENVDAKAISTITHSGSTARRIAKFRPQVPLVAFTESDKIRRQLALVWGVRPVKIDEIFDTDKSVRLMEEYLKNNGMVDVGDRIIIATGMPVAKRGRTNMIKVSTIE